MKYRFDDFTDSRAKGLFKKPLLKKDDETLLAAKNQRIARTANG